MCMKISSEVIAENNFSADTLTEYASMDINSFVENYVQKKEKRPLTYGETHPRFRIIFHILMEQPSFRNRIIVIKDDCSLWNLDISIIDKATLV
ncbi:fatty acyl-CoA reductase wat-like [Vespula squamosa]|uniref:Fatty acyl-CoA reductase wat-like n=1 Tax=Vespula squamosa TaxID=30214 RepID=A0ABD2BAF8_VESSQ